MPYAEKTTVPIERTKIEIERTLARYGATSFAYFSEADSATILFAAEGRRVRFDMPLPAPGGNAERHAKAVRQKWRAMLLCIKAKLEAVSSKIETFADASLAHIVLPDGATVGEHTRPAIKEAYESGHMPPLLLGPPSKK